MRKLVKNTGRLALALVIGLVVSGFSSAPVMADTNPVDLELGGEGATPWSITNVRPSDSGTKTVELHNAGSQDGFVTIWIEDIISTEGANPESETGDTAEPGESADYLLLNLTADGLSTSLNLPTTIGNLPQSVSAPDYIEVVPLKAGDTVNLQWAWEMPAQTGNEIQGDNLSFAINYLLRECVITDVSGVVTGGGVFTEEVIVASDGGEGEVTIGAGTTGLTEGGDPLDEIWLIELDREPPPPPEDTAVVGLHYEAGPHGTTFDQPVTITIAFDPGDIPQGADEQDLVIALWDGSDWVTLDGCVVDTVNNTISAPVSHFSRYAVISPTPEPPPAPADDDDEESTPAVGDEDDSGDVGLLEINILDDESSVEIGADGTVIEPFTLTDPGGNFVVDIDGGTRVTGADGLALSRIELSLTDRPVAVSDDVVLLSPVYELTGYDRNMEVTEINFEPSVTLTISYDPQNLPEGVLPPFVANYSDEEGLVPLPVPLGAVTEVGKARALVSHASLFVVAAEVVPPPPPLPASFIASDLFITPQRVEAGQSVMISLTVTNEGALAGTYELHLIIDGIVRAIEEVTLSGQSSETLTFKVSNLGAGSHRVKVAGLTGEFRVVSVDVALEEPEVDWLIVDLSVGAALVIGALVLYFILRRTRQSDFG